MKTKKYFLLFVQSKGADSRTDAELALGCRNGDKHCFDILAKRYTKPLHEFFYRLLHSTSAANDALQQTLLKAWLKLKEGEYKEEEHFRKWLFTIAYHEAIEALRKAKPWLHPEQMPEPPEDVEDNVREEQIKILDALIAKLPESERQVILLHDKMEMDYAQIGMQLGIRPSSARRTHERAVDALKRLLGKTNKRR